MRKTGVCNPLRCLAVGALVALAGLPGALGQGKKIPLQPFAQKVRQVQTALTYLGQPMAEADQDAINRALANPDEAAAVAEIGGILDRYVLVIVDINPESRVKVEAGLAKPDLVEKGTQLFLVKVVNRAGVTARLRVASPNSGPMYVESDGSPEPPKELSAAEASERWADISLYDHEPMSDRLSGLGVEYRVLEVYSRDRGQRSARISFSVGQGTQDIGFRNETVIVFDALPAHPLTLRVLDENGQPSFAAFIIRDRLGRVYPNPSKRLAPDFFFQPQVYRANGESVLVPDGSYTVICSMGPEYHDQIKQVEVAAAGPNVVFFAMQRWIDPAKGGWYSGDTHIHAAGCAHYQNPTEGVRPGDMMRQILGERLAIGSVLTWGPCYYSQKQFFSGKDDVLSRPGALMHYDLEVSGFPSSHAGHLVLLGLTSQEYPHCTRIEQWPTWDLPVLRWGKSQGAIVGFAHAGLGLEVKTNELPNYEMPSFDGIGANEYIVDVTYPDMVDFISGVDTPYVWELNIWYHTLNVGFRTRLSGETDFPCLSDNNVGQGRLYAKVDGPLTYDAWLSALRAGRSYVSDGRSHLMDFTLNGVGVGTGSSEVSLRSPGKTHVTMNASAYLDPIPAVSHRWQWVDRLIYRWDRQVRAGLAGLRTSFNAYRDYSLPMGTIQDRPANQQPYWDIERARVGTSRQVPVELVVNGEAVARQILVADGSVKSLEFDLAVERSSWVAVRILGSSHSNPIFVIVDGKPIRASRRSAEWCLASVNQLWTQKAPQISAGELPEARKAYDHARNAYTQLIQESDR